MTLLSGRVAKVAGFAEFAVGALSVEEAAQALAGCRVAAASHVRVDVVVAETRLARSARDQRVPEVIQVTLIAPDACKIQGYIFAHELGFSKAR